jgi:lipopolysaccharide export LptBFGC system permease protein LptF
VITFAVITGIFLIAGSLSILHKSEFLDLRIFLRGVYFFVGTNLDKILPMTVLVATIVSFGRWSSDNELNAIRHCGISLYHVLMPGLLFGTLGSAIVLYVNDQVAPRMELNRKSMIEASLSEAIEVILDRGGQEIELSDSMVMLFEEVDPEDHSFKRLRLKHYTEEDDDDVQEIKNEIRAQRGAIEVDRKSDVIRLHLYEVEGLSGTSEGMNLDYVAVPIHLNADAINKKPRHQTLAELVSAQDRRYKGDPKRKDLEGEFHRRVAGSFACMLFVLLAMPLAIIFRHGNRMVAFLIAFLVALVVYYPTFILGELLAKETDLSAALAMWSGSAVLFVLGGGLTAVVMRR